MIKRREGDELEGGEPSEIQMMRDHEDAKGST